MTPTKFEEQNAVLSGKELGVQDLPVHVGEDCIVSVWEPTEEEIAEITVTRKVYLCVVGRTHAPVFITGKKTDLFPTVEEDEEDVIE